MRSDDCFTRSPALGTEARNMRQFWHLGRQPSANQHAKQRTPGLLRLPSLGRPTPWPLFFFIPPRGWGDKKKYKGIKKRGHYCFIAFYFFLRRGGGYPPLKDGSPWTQGRSLGTLLLAPKSPSRSDPKIHQFFNRFPKLPKIIKKSIQNRIWYEKREFLKNSTSPTPNTDF